MSCLPCSHWFHFTGVASRSQRTSLRPFLLELKAKLCWKYSFLTCAFLFQLHFAKISENEVKAHHLFTQDENWAGSKTRRHWKFPLHGMHTSVIFVHRALCVSFLPYYCWEKRRRNKGCLTFFTSSPTLSFLIAAPYLVLQFLLISFSPSHKIMSFFFWLPPSFLPS